MSPLPEEYNATVLDHFLNPRNAGEVKDPTCVGSFRNPQCGDLLRLSLRIEQDVIREAKMRTFGCAAAIACASMLTEMLRGRTVDEASALRNRDVVAALHGLPEHKIVCSVSAEEVLRDALRRIRPSVSDAR